MGHYLEFLVELRKHISIKELCGQKSPKFNLKFWSEKHLIKRSSSFLLLVMYLYKWEFCVKQTKGRHVLKLSNTTVLVQRPFFYHICEVVFVYEENSFAQSQALYLQKVYVMYAYQLLPPVYIKGTSLYVYWYHIC